MTERWRHTFSALEISPGENGTTTLSGVAMDQAAVHGMLERIRDLGLSMVEVHVVVDEGRCPDLSPGTEDKP